MEIVNEASKSGDSNTITLTQTRSITSTVWFKRIINYTIFLLMFSGWVSYLILSVPRLILPMLANITSRTASGTAPSYFEKLLFSQALGKVNPSIRNGVEFVLLENKTAALITFHVVNTLKKWQSLAHETPKLWLYFLIGATCVCALYAWVVVVFGLNQVSKEEVVIDSALGLRSKVFIKNRDIPNSSKLIPASEIREVLLKESLSRFIVSPSLIIVAQNGKLTHLFKATKPSEEELLPIVTLIKQQFGVGVREISSSPTSVASNLVDGSGSDFNKETDDVNNAFSGETIATVREQ